MSKSVMSKSVMSESVISKSDNQPKPKDLSGLNEEQIRNIKHTEKRLKYWYMHKVGEDGSDTDKNQIKITLNSGLHIVEKCDTALSIAKLIKKKGVIACKKDGEFYDVWRPLENDCTLELFTLDDSEGQYVFWHSSAHILGQALEMKYQCNLNVGPPLDDGGFYYECKLPQKDGKEQSISSNDFKELEDICSKIIKDNQPFERLEVSKEDALELFKSNPYKSHIINTKIEDGGYCTIYKCGSFIDLCRGPHLPSTRYVGALKITSVSSSYFQNDKDKDELQRVYGISFKNHKDMKIHFKLLEEAKKRDHRKIGLEQELFFFSESSPGSCFFLPHGTRIYRKLQDFIRDEYWDRGFTEVISPNIAKKDLWDVSGHWTKYKTNMFCFSCDNKCSNEPNYGVKAMNCPLHCMIYKNKTKSYRDLPLRLADFGVLHRNELKGSLGGLFRVRRFQQDDAHIFCTREQVESEVKNCFDFLKCVYNVFGFEMSFELSTRPNQFIGDIELWDEAEKQLHDILEKSQVNWVLNEGDGAFYGPKIDIHIRDALKRSHQCATIQLDFNLPNRFDLEYVEDGSAHRPVMIHRAIYGSFERFMGILIEHYGGKWPFWLSPRQAIVIPISDKFLEYAQQIKNRIHKCKNKYYVDIDTSDNTIKKKIRNAESLKYNFMIVVGEKELNANNVNVRFRDTKQQIVMDVSGLLALFEKLEDEKK